MEYPASDYVFGNPFGDVSYMPKSPKPMKENLASSGKVDFTPDIFAAGMATIERMKAENLSTEGDAKRLAFFGDLDDRSKLQDTPALLPDADSTETDQIFSFRAAFSGFIFSVVDTAPSEIAVILLKNVNALARWNAMRTTDASVIASVGWLQVDNHIPNAPFPVAMRPDDSVRDSIKEDDDIFSVQSDLFSVQSEMSETDGGGSSPLVVVGLSFAPSHKSGIVVSFCYCCYDHYRIQYVG
jgi:hypothetical protein